MSVLWESFVVLNSVFPFPFFIQTSEMNEKFDTTNYSDNQRLEDPSKFTFFN